ncbi:hypothetical protein B0H14DRAFT_2562435 [Mycena olivaceomarginata]|nr:hypothetical protein B0H14DRAFT_2562435 [Mycena olivaceomarginata]
MDPPPPLPPLVDDEDELPCIAPMWGAASNPTAVSAGSNPAPVPNSTAVSNPTAISDPNTAAAAWGIAEMTEALRAEIVEMSEEGCAAYTSRLRRMSSFELTREINNAHNHRVVLDMGLGGVTAFFGMKKRVWSRTRSGNTKKRRKANNVVEQDSLSSNDDDSEGEDDSGDESEGGSRRTPVQTRGSVRALKTGSRRQVPQMGRLSQSRAVG